MTLDELNVADRTTLAGLLLACCDVPRWAEAVSAGRPYADPDALLAVADRAAGALTPAEVDRALAAHPRIGERATRVATSDREAAWSRQEQSSVDTGADTQQALAAGNRAYEAKFGRVFLICATGLAGEQVLESLRTRLDNDAETEAVVVADELRKIAVLRLTKAVAA